MRRSAQLAAANSDGYVRPAHSHSNFDQRARSHSGAHATACRHASERPDPHAGADRGAYRGHAQAGATSPTDFGLAFTGWNP